jgi:glycosyltransferase involved in cell wall biosynthesis
VRKLRRVPRILTERLTMDRHLIPHMTRTSSGKPILFIIPWMVVGGADKVNLDIVSGLDRNRFQPHIITTVPARNSWHERFSALTPFITHLPGMVDSANHCLYIREYVEKIKIRTILISNSSRGYQAIRMIKQRLPGVRILDLLHAEHGDFPTISAPFDRDLDRRIVVSQYLKDHLVRHQRICADRIEVIHNGIDVELVRRRLGGDSQYRRQFGIPREAFVVVYVGRFAPEKRPDRVIESFVGLRRERTGMPVRLVMAGDGELRDALVAQASALGIGAEVHFTGYIDDVSRLLVECDALVLSSETEGIPVVVLEAMALGVPVVATAVGGIPEMIEPGRTGLLVESDGHAVQGIQDHLLTLLADQRRRERISQEATLRVQREFSLTHMVQQYEAVL